MTQGLIGSGERVCLADLCVVSGARADAAGKGFSVDFHQTEAGPEALVPFEVVEKRPVEVAFDIGVIFYCAVNGCE